MENLTELEQRAIDAPINLTDGHPRQELTDSQYVIVERFAEYFRWARKENFRDVEMQAQQAFLHALGQVQAPIGDARVWSIYSSSVGTMVVARVLRGRGVKTAVIHPTFDNIPTLLSDLLELIPITESEIENTDLSAMQTAGATCIWVTMPNNPTGWVLGRDQFCSLAEEAARRGIVLCLDTSFRGFDVRAQYDMYEYLEAAGTEYMVIEDTGKLWPMGELKLSFVAASRSFRREVEHALSDVLLTVSPVILRLVEELARDAAAGGFKTLRELISRNRAAVATALEPHGTIADSDSRISVCRVRFGSAEEALGMRQSLEERGVYTLPCHQFHWARPAEGAQYLRISLGRDRALLDAALQRLEK